MKPFFCSLSVLSLLFALAAAMPVRAQEAVAPAPAPQEQQVEKVNLYVISHVNDGDTVGQAFVDEFSKSLSLYKALNVITTEATTEEAPNAPLTATQFRLLTVKTGDGNSVVAITVLRLTKGFPNAVYVGTVLATATAENAADKADEYIGFLGTVFASIEQTGEYDQAPPAAKQ